MYSSRYFSVIRAYHATTRRGNQCVIVLLIRADAATMECIILPRRRLSKMQDPRSSSSRSRAAGLGIIMETCVMEKKDHAKILANGWKFDLLCAALETLTMLLVMSSYLAWKVWKSGIE